MSIRAINQGETMASWPQRPREHVVGDRAVLALRDALPEQWIFRELTSDYGIDGEIEAVDESGAVTGALVKVQVKGTASAVEVVRNSVSVDIDTVRYWLSLPVPVIVVRATQYAARVLWLDVREYLLERGHLDSIFITKRRTIQFDFKKAYELPADAGKLEELALEHQADVSGMHLEALDRIVGDFMGYVILIRLFDGDADAWIKWLREKGSDQQLIHGFPFVVWVKEQIKRDPDLLCRVRKMVDEYVSPGRTG
jgi:hypothetical protein